MLNRSMTRYLQTFLVICLIALPHCLSVCLTLALVRPPAEVTTIVLEPGE